MLLTKIISGVVVGAAIVLSVLFFKLAWLLMVVFLSVTSSYELYRILQTKAYRVQFVLPALLNVILLTVVYLLVDSDISTIVDNWVVGHAHVISLMNMLVMFALLVLIIRTLFLVPRATIPELVTPLFQIIYLGWFPCFFILLRSIPQGEYFLIWGLSSVAFSDIGAYFAGKYLGKRPYFQHLSPNKTREGAMGGILTSIGVAFLVAAILGKHLPMPWYHILILAVGAACLGQVGDLVESLLKRDAQLKDSGTFIPGHGGMLDRIDSYFLLSPFLYYYLVNFVI